MSQRNIMRKPPHMAKKIFSASNKGYHHISFKTPPTMSQRGIMQEPTADGKKNFFSLHKGFSPYFL